MGSPIITGQPASQTVNVGQTASFTVTATGTPAPTFQWQRNSVDIPGATSATYMTPATEAGDNNATYRVVVSSGLETVTSDPVTLTVLTQMDNWRIANFSGSDLADSEKETTVWGNLADPDKDGLSNLLEYALGQSPLIAQTAGLPTLGRSAAGRVTFTFQRDPSLADINYIVEASPDLTSWTPIATSTGGGAMQKLEGAFAVTETGAPLKFVTVEDNELISGTTKRYFRLRIHRP